MVGKEQFELPFENGFGRLLSVEDIYENSTPTLLRMVREDRRIERKSVSIQSKDLGDVIAMWANTAPDGGLIAVGISNSGELEGVKHSSIEHINQLERSGDVFCPDARF